MTSTTETRGARRRRVSDLRASVAPWLRGKGSSWFAPNPRITNHKTHESKGEAAADRKRHRSGSVPFPWRPSGGDAGRFNARNSTAATGSTTWGAEAPKPRAPAPLERAGSLGGPSASPPVPGRGLLDKSGGGWGGGILCARVHGLAFANTAPPTTRVDSREMVEGTLGFCEFWTGSFLLNSSDTTQPCWSRRYSTVTATRNGAEIFLAEMKSRLSIGSSGRGLFQVTR